LLLSASSFALSSQSVFPVFLELFENVLWGGFFELGAKPFLLAELFKIFLLVIISSKVDFFKKFI